MGNGETGTEKRVRAIETVCAAQRANYRTQSDTLEDHEGRMRDIEKLLPALRAVMWAGSVLAGSVIVFIWSLITGHVEVMFR